MMRSLFSGVAGLKTHQTRMDVIGNNIANVNTVGYKAAQMTFQDTISQTMQNATGPSESSGRAGVNAKQIGLGVSTATIYNNITTGGAAETTGNPFDVRLNGDSFFIVNNGGNKYYTRAGAFNVDMAGTLCMQSNGYTVQGYGTITDSSGEIVPDTSQVKDLKIMTAENMVNAPEPTTKAYFTGILDSNSAALNTDKGQVLQLAVYDSEGYEYNIQFKLINKDASGAELPQGQFRMSVTDIIDANGKTISGLVQGENPVGTPISGGETDSEYAARKEEWFTKTNGIFTAYSASGSPVDSDGVLTMTFDNENGEIEMPKIKTEDTTNTNADKPEGSGFILNMGAIGTAAGIAAFANPIEVDISTMQNINNNKVSTINGSRGQTDSTAGAGWKVGNLSGISIGVDGRITGSYTNGQTKLLGQIATATFSNAAGLEKAGENLFASTMNSGDAVIGEVTTGGGSMATGELEMSNVDLSSEFTTMITTQRGFQANSRIISVSDTLLEELVNLKR